MHEASGGGIRPATGGHFPRSAHPRMSARRTTLRDTIDQAARLGRAAFLPAVGLAAVFVVAACDGGTAPSANAVATANTTGTAAPASPETREAGAPGSAAASDDDATPADDLDGVLGAAQVELLEIANEAVSALPLNPFVKDRSREQEDVVAACLELGAPARAERYLDGIVNWRRGAARADLARHLAEHGGDAEAIERHLARAEDLARSAEDWRRDRIRVKIASVRVLQGRAADAIELETGVGQSEQGKVDRVRARGMTREQIDQYLAAIDELALVANFDVLRNALFNVAELHALHYGDAELRELLEQRIQETWDPLPEGIRVDLMLVLAGNAVDADDDAHAIELLDRTRLLVETGRWAAEYRVPVQARMAALRGRAGQTGAARSALEGAAGIFDRDLRTIGKVFRADALRPVAEAWMALGDHEAALAAYRRVVEIGADNNNARPRAEDLAATCLSMAVHGCTPDAALMDRLHELRGGLEAPW